MGKNLSFVQWTVHTISQSTNTMFTLIVNCQYVSLRSVWCTVTKNQVPLQVFNVYVKCHWTMDILSLLQNKSKKNSRKFFNWSLMFMKISTWLITVSVCLIVTLQISTSTLTMMKCGKMLNACWKQLLMTWVLNTTKLKVKQPFMDQNWISKLRLLLVRKKLFLPSSWTFCFQNVLTFTTSELTVKNTVQWWFTVGLSQLWNALLRSCLRTTRGPSQHGLPLTK